MAEDKTLKNYVCPKCKVKVTSSVPLEFCVCGGKYETTVEKMLREAMAYPDNPFGDIFK